MEFFLNLVGLLVALAISCLWLQRLPRAGFGWKTQLVALALLIVILFPVISVTDDLLAAQNPAETDSCTRRDHTISSAYAAPSLAAISPEAPPNALAFGFLGPAAPDVHPLPMAQSAAMAPIENRPPPIA
jgi:hypothetical protein